MSTQRKIGLDKSRYQFLDTTTIPRFFFFLGIWILDSRTSLTRQLLTGDSGKGQTVNLLKTHNGSLSTSAINFIGHETST